MYPHQKEKHALKLSDHRQEHFKYILETKVA